MTNSSPSRLPLGAATMGSTVSPRDAVANHRSPPWRLPIRFIRNTCHLPRPAPSPASPRARCGAPSRPGSCGRITLVATCASSWPSCGAGSKPTAPQRSVPAVSPFPRRARGPGADRCSSVCASAFSSKGRPDADPACWSSDRRSAARVHRAGRSAGARRDLGYSIGRTDAAKGDCR